MPKFEGTVYEVTIVCSTPECGTFVTERTNHMAIDDSRMRADLERRHWVCWTDKNKEGWKFAIDLCPRCAVRPEAKKLITQPPEDRYAPLGTLPARKR